MNHDNLKSSKLIQHNKRVLIVTGCRVYPSMMSLENGMRIVSDLTGAGYPFDVVGFKKFTRMNFDLSDPHDIIFLNGHTTPVDVKEIALKCREAIKSGRKIFINGHLPYTQYDDKGKLIAKMMYSEDLFDLRCVAAWGFGKAKVPERFEKDKEITRMGCLFNKFNSFRFSKSPEVEITLGRLLVGFLTLKGGAIDGSSEYLLNLIDYGKIVGYLRYGRSEIIGFANDRVKGRPIASFEVHCDITASMESVDTLETFTKNFDIPLTCLLVLSRCTEDSNQRWNKASQNPLIYIGSHSKTHPHNWEEVASLFDETNGAIKKQRQCISRTGSYFNFSGRMNPTVKQIHELFKSDTVFGARGNGLALFGLPFGRKLQSYQNKPIHKIIWKIVNRLKRPFEIQLMPTCENWFSGLSQSESAPYCLSHTLLSDYAAYRSNENYTELVKKFFYKNLKYGLYSFGYLHDYSLDSTLKKFKSKGIHLKYQIKDAIAFLYSQNVVFLDTESLIKRLRDFVSGWISCKTMHNGNLEVRVFRPAAISNQIKIERGEQCSLIAKGNCIIQQTMVGKFLYVDLKPEVESTFEVQFF